MSDFKVGDIVRVNPEGRFYSQARNGLGQITEDRSLDKYYIGSLRWRVDFFKDRSWNAYGDEDIILDTPRSVTPDDDFDPEDIARAIEFIER